MIGRQISQAAAAAILGRLEARHAVGSDARELLGADIPTFRSIG